MVSKIFKENKRTITLLVGLIIIIFFLETSGILNIAKSPLQKVLTPIQLALYKTKLDISDFFNTIADISSLRESESQLELENAKLLAENARLKRLEKENEILRNQLGVKKVESKMLLANVIGSDPLVSSSQLVLDKGKKQGVERGDLVVLEDILLGEVINPGVETCTARLLNDSETKIPVTLDSGVKGILKGEFGSRMVLENIIQGKPVNKGQIVFSSGEAGYPRGLVLGKVEKVDSDPAALFQKAQVVPLVSFDSLEIVFIIKR